MTTRTTLRRAGTALAAAAVGTTVALLGPGPAHADHEDGPTTRELLDACGTMTDVCEFHPDGEPAITLGEKELVVDNAINCTGTTQPLMRNWLTTSGGANSAGVSVKAEYKFVEAFKASVEVRYNREWNWSDTVGSQVNLNVAPDKVGQAYYQPELETIRGRYEMHFPDRFHGHYIWYVPFELTRDVNAGGDPTTSDTPSGITFSDRDLNESERAGCPDA